MLDLKIHLFLALCTQTQAVPFYIHYFLFTTEPALEYKLPNEYLLQKKHQYNGTMDQFGFCLLLCKTKLGGIFMFVSMA